MEEKIKIYVTKSINNILLKDMERFEFYKKDGSFNKNEFYNTLIVNYYEQYESSQNDIYKYIKDTVKERTSLSDLEVSDISSDILKYIDTNAYQTSKEKYDVSLSLKPTKKSSDDFEYIQSCLLSYTTLSNYFRNMFASYCLLPQDKRERIIFKENFEILEKAIEEKRKVFITMATSRNSYTVSPYAIANSKEELFNYLICQKDKLAFSYRIGRIKQVKILNEDCVFDEDIKDIMDSMIEYGPQFSYPAGKKKEPVKVQLTERGADMLKKIYLHRPRLIERNGDIYTFDCPRSQAFQYFSRFGFHALVLEPWDLKEEIERFYHSGFNRYTKLQRNKQN